MLGAGRRISEMRKSCIRLVSAFKNVYSLIGETNQHIIQESKSKIKGRRERVSIQYKMMEEDSFKLSNWNTGVI